MEVVGTLVWYICFVFTVWVPFRDTAAMSVLSSSRSRTIKMMALLISIPVIIALIEGAAIITVESGQADAFLDAAAAATGVGEDSEVPSSVAATRYRPLPSYRTHLPPTL